MIHKMIKWAFGLLILISISGYAQTIKTGVLVYGNQSSAIGAALQSAKSGAKTVLLFPQKEMYFNETDFKNSMYGMTKCVADTILKLDSTRKIPIDFSEKVKTYLDSLPNLTLIRGIDVKGAERKGKYWQVMLNTNSVLKADEIVDATFNGKLAALAGATINPKTKYINSLHEEGSFPFEKKFTSGLRTALNTGFDNANAAHVLPMLSFLAKGKEHLILAGLQYQGNNDAIQKPGDFNTGQVAGAIAAYASIFKAQISKITEAKIRIIQTELLNYQLSIFDLADVTNESPYWRAVQNTLLSGFFIPEKSEKKLYFHPEKEVTIGEIQPILQQYYFKTAIWFEDHPIKNHISTEQAIELACYLGNKGLLLSKDRIVRNWDKTYGFGVFDPKKNITRAEFSVLVKDILMSFNAEINIAGEIRE